MHLHAGPIARRLKGGLALLLLPFALTSCLVAPTTFNSTLDIRADRSFTFTYVGEIMAMDEKGGGSEAITDADNAASDDSESASSDGQEATQDRAANQKTPDSEPDKDAAKLEALAKTLSQEYGFRSARYIGNHRLAIDYAISGKLDRTFIFPFNLDGEVIMPFLAIEPRGKDRLRVKAPAFANQRPGSGPDMASMGGGADSPGEALDGTFTLTTDAEIISQNQEDGATTIAGGRKKIVWRVTPATKDAPVAVLKLAPLP